jgi:hypothetical protein
MKMGVIVIGLMILLASTAVVMGQGDPSRLFIEGNKVMILHYNDLPYKIELTGPDGVQYTSEYTGNIGRDTGKAKLFTVVFADPDSGTTNPTGDLYENYVNVNGEEASFELNQVFDAKIWINNDGTGEPTLTGQIVIIEEVEEEPVV